MTSFRASPPAASQGIAEPDLRRRVAVGTAWAAGATWGRQILQLAVFVVLARLLGPEVYGVLTMVLIVTASCQVLINDGGWQEALIARPDIDDRHLDSVFWTVLGLSVALAASLALAAPIVAAGFDAPAVAVLLPPLALTLPLSALALVPEALLRRGLRFAPLAAAAWLALLAGGAVGIGMALTGCGAWSFVGYHLTEVSVRLVVIAQAGRWIPALRFSWPHLRAIVRYARNVFGENLLQVVDYLLPRSVVAVALGPVALGYFGMARKVAELLEEAVLGPLASVALPAFAGLRGAPARLAAAVAVALRLGALVALPACLGLAATAPALVRAALGEEWAPTAAVLQLLALALLVMPVIRVARALMQGLGHVGWQLVLAAASTAVLALSVAVLAPFGLQGIAAALALQSAFMLPVCVAVVGRVSGIDLLAPLARVLPTVTAAILMAAAVLAWRALAPAHLPDLLVLTGAIPIGVAAYVGALALLDPALPREAWAMLRALRGRATGT